MRVGLLQSIRGRNVVDVGAERERHAPVRHRRGGILRRGELERLERLLVVEAVEQRQAFVEELLRVGVRGLDRAVIRTEIAEQRRARRAPPARRAVRIMRRLIGRRRRRRLARARDATRSRGQRRRAATTGTRIRHALCLRLRSHNTVSAPNNRLAMVRCPTCAAGNSEPYAITAPSSDLGDRERKDDERPANQRASAATAARASASAAPIRTTNARSRCR